MVIGKLHMYLWQNWQIEQVLTECESILKCSLKLYLQVINYINLSAQALFTLS